MFSCGGSNSVQIATVDSGHISHESRWSTLEVDIKDIRLIV